MTTTSEGASALSLADVLEMQRRLQVEAYGDGSIDAGRTPEQQIESVKMNVLALTDELHEVLAETNWKPWKQGTGIKDLGMYKEEMVDAFHFFLNLMINVDMSAEELLEGYVKKNAINRQRQAENY